MEFSIAINNKLKFLLSSLIILGRYIAAHDCECKDNGFQINKDNNNLIQLCKKNNVEINASGNIKENENFLQEKPYLRKLYLIYDKISYGGYKGGEIMSERFEIKRKRINVTKKEIMEQILQNVDTTVGHSIKWIRSTDLVKILQYAGVSSITPDKVMLTRIYRNTFA